MVNVHQGTRVLTGIDPHQHLEEISVCIVRERKLSSTEHSYSNEYQSEPHFGQVDRKQIVLTPASIIVLTKFNHEFICSQCGVRYPRLSQRFSASVPSAVTHLGPGFTPACSARPPAAIICTTTGLPWRRGASKQGALDLEC